MTLLEIITKAASTNPNFPDGEFNYPVVLNPEQIFLKLKPETDDSKAPMKKVTGWELSQTDGERSELGHKFFKNLKIKLKNTVTLGKDEFWEMFTSHLLKIGEKVGISVKIDKSGKGVSRKLIEKAGFLLGRDVKSLVLEACITLEVWDVLESLIYNKLVEYSCISNLVHNLIEKCRSDLIVLCLKRSLDMQAYDLMCILKYFLVMPGDGYKSLISVRKDWESQALLAIEKAKSVKGDEKILAQEASVLVMLAHDGFSVTELCLHYLLASRNLDEVIFSACIGKLNVEEFKALVSYLGKWVRKYERFPQVVPCPDASSVLGLIVCDWIPSLEIVVKCVGFVVDEHFSSLVFHSDITEELRSLEGVIGSLADEARLCGTLSNLAERLRKIDEKA